MNAELSLAAFDTLWEDLGLGGVPFPLEVYRHGATVADRDRIKAAVYADLERRALAMGVQVDEDLADELRLLAEPAVGIDLVALLEMADSDPVKALAVTRGRQGLLAVQQKTTVSLRGIPDTGLAEAIVDLLPPTPAGAGKSITQPVAVLRPGQPTHSRVRPGGVLRTVTPRLAADSKLRAIAAILERPVLAAGQLGITRVDDFGKRHRQPGIGWFDTDHGRYATTMSTGPDGDDWVTVWPADNPRLAQRLADAVAALVPESRRGPAEDWLS